MPGRSSRFLSVAFLAMPAIVCLGGSAGEANTQSFRVEIEVRDGDGTNVAKHVVLFKDDVIYDFALSEPHDVTVIHDDRVWLISRREQIKASVPNETLVQETARARADANQKGRAESVGLAAEPKCEGNVYTLAFDNRSGRYGYEVVTDKPTHAQQAARFAEFTDWMCRINLVRRLGPLPPFARMKLTQKIAADGLIPQEVELECSSKQFKRTFVSRYTFSDKLSEADDRRVSEIDEWMRRYRDVPFEQFPR